MCFVFVVRAFQVFSNDGPTRPNQGIVTEEVLVHDKMYLKNKAFITNKDIYVETLFSCRYVLTKKKKRVTCLTG